jgi:hypothetical protein
MLGSFQDLFCCLAVEVRRTVELDEPLILFVKHDHEDLLVADSGELNCFLQEASLSFEIGYYLVFGFFLHVYCVDYLCY